jgi:alkanesulfonate monooxygenase SsuD/methylene tetrahydromethanopterin reductase-like flavin-dependent oxidoreductase (luciferase family)
MYPSLPSYKAMLDKEGVDRPSGIALVGSEEQVREGLARLADAGADDFVASVIGNPEEKERSSALLLSPSG